MELSRNKFIWRCLSYLFCASKVQNSAYFKEPYEHVFRYFNVFLPFTRVLILVFFYMFLRVYMENADTLENAQKMRKKVQIRNSLS